MAKSETMESNVTPFADKAKDMASNIKDRAQEYGEKAVDQTSEIIQKYPTQSLLVGFGLGLVAGLVFARR